MNTKQQQQKKEEEKCQEYMHSKVLQFQCLNLPFSTENARSAVSPGSPVPVWSSVAAPAAENRLAHL